MSVEKAGATATLDLAAAGEARPAEGFVGTAAGRTFFLLIGLQGLHLVEHIVQVYQIYYLHILNGRGMLGSVFDIEPVHFAYNTVYLGLLIAAYVLLGLHRDGASRLGYAVYVLMTFAVVFQSWHQIEHLFKLVQYFQLGFQNGTGGILGAGPGGLFPLLPVPILHLDYNTIVYAPAVATFVLLVSGWPRPAHSR